MHWKERDGAERNQPRTGQSFCVPKAEIVSNNNYDLSLHRYKESAAEDVDHKSPNDIIKELRVLEADITAGLNRLAAMVAV